MKTTAHKLPVKPESKTSNRRGVQLEARRGGGNRHRADAFERQAEDLADRFIRGGKSLAQNITPRAAASLKGQSGGGMQLPRLIRDEMEGAFGADLGAVRIHTDTAADATAREFKANALASGRHIYFRSGFYSPHTAIGRELLAHELVHVLQQTGRRNKQGMLIASDRSGESEPQYQDEDTGPHRDALVPFLDATADAKGELAKRHRAAADTDETLKKLTAEVDRLAPAGLPRKTSSTIGGWLIKTAADGKFTDKDNTDHTLTVPARGFLIDCLKVCDTEAHYDAIITLLEQDTKFEIKTAFGPRTKFRDYVRTKKGEQWLSNAFTHTLLKDLWPFKFKHTFAQFFLSPGRTRQALYGLPELKAKEFANLDATSTTLMPSDRVILAFQVIAEYDATRLQWLEFLQGEAEKEIPDAPAVNKRYALALLMRDFLAGKLKETHPPFWKAMLVELHRITGDAVKLWGDVLAAHTELENSFADEDLVSQLLTTTRPISGEHDSLKPLRAILAAMDKEAGAAAKGKTAPPPGLLYLEIKDKQPMIPTPSEYAKRIEGLDHLLGLRSNAEGNVLLTLQIRLVELSLKNELPSDEATAIGYVIHSLQQFAPRLFAYDSAKDTASYPDLRLQHRIDVASYLVTLAQALSWPEVHSIGAIVLTGADFPTSYLVIPGPWVRIDEAPIEQLAKDFNADVPFNSLPLTPRELVFYFSGAFFRGLAALVQAEVDRVNADPNAKVDATALNATILALPRPWRIDPPLSAQRIVRAVDAGTTDAITLIANNAKSVAEIDRIGKESKLGPKPPWIARRRGVDDSLNPLQIFAWILPDLKPLIQELRKVEPFKTRMAGSSATDDFAWLKELMTKPGATGKTVRQEIDEALTGYAQAGQKQAHSALRQFTIINRRQAAEILRLKLMKFALKPTVENFAIPYQFANEVVNMAVAVVPSIDEKPQTSLFLLDLAPAIDQAFGSVNNAARLQPYMLTFFQDAVSFAKEAATALHTNSSPELKGYYEAFLYRNPKDPAKDESLATLTANASHLETVIKSMEEAMKTMQMMFGFLSRDGVSLQSVLIGPAINLTPMHLLNPFRETPLINDPRILPGEENVMEIDGDDWELVQVHRKFFYHPAMENAAPGSEAAKAVLVDEKERPISSGTPLMTFAVNGEERTISAGNDVELKKLSDAVFTHTLVQKLEQMAAEIEEDMNFLMDVVELVPGVGQKFAAARASSMTVGAIASGEYDELFKIIKEDPIGFIKQIGSDLIEKYITVEGVLSFIVLGQSGIDWTKWRKPSKSSRPPQTKNPPRGKIAKLIALLRRLGARIANAIGWVRMRTVPVLRAVQSTIATRPRVGWLLRRSFDIATWLTSLIPPDSGASPAPAEERRLEALRDLARTDPQVAPPTPTTTTPPTPGSTMTPAQAETASLQAMLGPVGEGMAAAAGEFRTQLNELVDSLQQMELPKEVFPLEFIIDVMTEFVLTRLGAKVKFAYKALKASGLVGAIQEKVAEKLRGIPGDPNLLWQEHVLTKIDARFHEVRNSTVESIYGITNTLAAETGLPFLALGPPPLVSEFKIQKSEFPKQDVGTFPEGQLYRRPERRVDPLPGVEELPEGAGLELPPNLREKAELHFGHDFGHVRIHAEPDARQLLETLGAEALTSGSHVYLSSEQQVDEANILRHELTHVLQQAGERPLGADYSPQPVPGRPGIGIRFYPERESEADAHARRRNSTRKPVRVKQARGVQPAGLDQGLLDKLITAFTEVESAKQFEKTPVGTVPNIEKANAFFGAFVRFLNNKSLVTFPDCFADVATDLLAYVKSKKMEEDVAKVAALAQKPSGNKQKRKQTTELDFPRFVTLFEGALFGKTGVVAQFTAKDDPAVDISKVEITYVHLGAIPPTSNEALKLWEEVVKNTPGLPSVQKKTALYFEIYEWLHGLGAQPFIWELGKKPFRFSSDFVEAFTKTRKTQLAGKVPKKGVYLDETATTGLGLNIGVHAGQKGEQRESHHMTQYLLVQFFRNDNAVKAWESGRDYPGIDPATGSASRTVFNIDASTGLGLADLDKDTSKRGSHMPAILISADLHRRGQLHVERESQWKGPALNPDSDQSQGRSTQGFAIKAQFQRELHKQFKVTDHDAALWNKTVGGMPKTEAAKGIGNAMLGTYKWMNNIMIPALERGLMTRELAYYNAMAARDGITPTSPEYTDYHLIADDMRSVASKAKAKNKEIMEAAKWVI